MRFGWNNILLFLFSVLTALNLICGVRASSIILDRPWRSRGPGLHFELASGGPGTLHFSGLGEWAGRPVFLILSKNINNNREKVKKILILYPLSHFRLWAFVFFLINVLYNFYYLAG